MTVYMYVCVCDAVFDVCEYPFIVVPRLLVGVTGIPFIRLVSVCVGIWVCYLKSDIGSASSPDL